MTIVGGTMNPELGLGFKTQAPHFSQLRSRISSEPYCMTRQQRLAVGDKAFEMSASDPYFFELARLPISFSIQLGCTRLTSSAPEPRMSGDARNTDGDPV